MHANQALRAQHSAAAARASNYDGEAEFFLVEAVYHHGNSARHEFL
jgi:hypothetical protein